MSHILQKLFLGLAGLLLILSCKSVQDNKQSQKLPNILILHVDDLGYHDLSSTGSQIYQTPNIDNFSTQAVNFTNAYANYPRCVPSRFGMLTSGYPVQNGDVPDDGFSIENLDDAHNVTKAIQNRGYQTAYFGKFHLGDKNTIHKLGFETSLGAGHAGSPISYFQPFNIVKGHRKQPKKKPIPDLDSLSNKGDYLTDVLTDQAINYIKNRKKDKPFMEC